ncbi:MAG: hypothetical protein Q4A30_00775 [Candidatus Saccharibacteria bacterium]|nr:hypothetical protein [Candidatus Saccharibacteria bacterium]
MAIIVNIKTRGSSSLSTLSGNIVLDEQKGELRISRKINGSPVVINKIDINGNHYYDIHGVERISTGIDPSSGRIRELFFDEDGKSQIIIGQNPKNGKQIIAVSKPGVDIIKELNN